MELMTYWIFSLKKLPKPGRILEIRVISKFQPKAAGVAEILFMWIFEIVIFLVGEYFARNTKKYVMLIIKLIKKKNALNIFNIGAICV
jgi:uncharacterized membrane protein